MSTNAASTEKIVKVRLEPAETEWAPAATAAAVSTANPQECAVRQGEQGPR